MNLLHRRAYGHGLRQRPYFHAEIDIPACSGVQHDARLLGCAETLLFRRYIVSAFRQRGKNKDPVVSGDDRSFEAGLGVRCRDSAT